MFYADSLELLQLSVIRLFWRIWTRCSDVRLSHLHWTLLFTFCAIWLVGRPSTNALL